MINDFKNYQARPKINRDRVIACVLFIALVIVLSVRLEPASAEPQLAVITYDCAPAMEMGMPIQEVRL
ncbi:hypothetical protein SAMN06298226_2763 [Nitrosovibrio sp. Nv4]|nr:hypothetical protein SAMN06298226_2763 [Nitrosovibrio sp. Nv4]